MEVVKTNPTNSKSEAYDEFIDFVTNMDNRLTKWFNKKPAKRGAMMLLFDQEAEQYNAGITIHRRIKNAEAKVWMQFVKMLRDHHDIRNKIEWYIKLSYNIEQREAIKACKAIKQEIQHKTGKEE